MSIYTFATENFTTSDDRHRRPAIDKWQIARTVAFLFVAFVALVCVAKSAQAGPTSLPPLNIVAV